MQYRLDEEDVYKLKSIYIMVKLHEAIKHKPDSEMSFIPNTHLGSAVKKQKFILDVIENYDGYEIYHDDEAKKLENLVDVERHLLIIGLFGSTRFILRIDSSSSTSLDTWCRIDVGSGSSNNTFKHELVSIDIDRILYFKDDSSKLLEYFESNMRPVIVDILRRSIIEVDW